MNRIELVFRQRPVPQSELDRNVVKPAGREAAIEMPQSRNDHAYDRDLDIGTRLIEDEEIEAARGSTRRTQASTCSRVSRGANFAPKHPSGGSICRSGSEYG